MALPIQTKLKMAFLLPRTTLSLSVCVYVAVNHCSVPNEFKDDWNEMHIATRHSATWRNTYQPQILPYILNIVTLTAIAYSSKRIYWHRAIAGWKCWLVTLCTLHSTAHTAHEHIQTGSGKSAVIQFGRRLKSRALNIEMGAKRKMKKNTEQIPEQL